MDATKRYNSRSGTESLIQRFYAGKHIFLTGCTGFLGILILEKLLRTCTDVSKIYIMIRQKKGINIEERMKKLFEVEVFDVMREKNPNFMDKIVPVYGDLHKPDLGLSAEDRQLLVNNVNIIIHNASMVYFEAKASLLLRINVIGTQKMLELAEECKNLDVFVYMSTAYSHHYDKLVKEEFRPPPCGLKMVEDMIRADEENAAGLSKEALKDIIGEWINIYSFSKAIAEGLVEDFARRKSLPCTVYRPSIVTETLDEPIKGWVGNTNGPAFMFLALGLGVLHVMHIDEDLCVDWVPADYTTNSLLATIWDYVQHRETNDPQVYNYGSSHWHPFIIRVLKQTISTAVEKCPSSKTIWYPTYSTINNKYLFLIMHMIWHIIPVIIADASLLVRGKKPKMVQMMSKMYKHHKALFYFFSSHWVIKTDRTKRILSRMNAADLRLFPFDLKQVDWSKKMEMSLYCNRRLLKEPWDSIPEAQKKLQKLKKMHYTVVTLLGFLSLFVLHRIICNLSVI